MHVRHRRSFGAIQPRPLSRGSAAMQPQDPRRTKSTPST